MTNKNFTNNVFNKLVKNENTLTECFRNLLGYKSFLKLFLLFLKNKCGDISFSSDEIETQKDLSEYGKPDIYIENNKTVIIIENKLKYTSLTNNQPLSYLQYLINNDKQFKYLIFIISKVYIHLNELNNIIKETDSVIPIKLVFWEDFLDQLVLNCVS